MKAKFPILSVLIGILVVFTFSGCSILNRLVISSSVSEDSSGESSSLPSESSQAESEQADEEEDPPASQEESRESNESTEEPEPQMVRIDADDGLRMREGPGTEYEVVKLIPHNQYVQLSDKEEPRPGWVFVFYDGDYGWVSTEFIVYGSANEPTADWAKAYYDFLSGYESVTYTSTMYGSQHVIAGHVFDGEMRGANLVEFWKVQGYDYPVLMSNEIPIDADGNTDVPMFSPIIYLVVGGQVVEVAQAERSGFFQESSDGPGLDVVGELVVSFILKPENGGSPDNVRGAMEWLSTQ